MTRPAVVMRLAESVPKGSHIFTDRFFTTVSLVEELGKEGKFGSGTMKANRLSLSWVTDRTMKRGDYDQFIAKNLTKMYAVKWMDNKSVKMDG